METETSAGMRLTRILIIDRKRIFSTIRRLVLILLVAAVYYAVARVQQAPAGKDKFYPLNFWPSAGLALVAVMMLGRPMAICVFLGSFLFRLGTLSGPWSILASVLVGAGFAFQSLAGDWLSRKAFKTKTPLTVRGAIAAMVVVLLTAGISNVFGVTGLCATGFEAWGSYGTIAWRWWLGSVCGILVVTPTIVILSLLALDNNVRAFLWVPRVERGALRQYENSLAARPGPTFHVYKQDKDEEAVSVRRDRDEYFPIDPIYPAALVEGSPGLDLGSNVECLLAIAEA